MPPVSRYALYLLILALPFNGLKPLLSLGELSSEGFFYASLVYVLVATISLLASGRIPVTSAKSVLASQRGYLFLIIVSLGVSLSTIYQNKYGARAGPERYFLSLLTYVYYLMLTCLLAAHANAIGIKTFVRSLSKAFVGLGWLLVAICIIEVVSWFVEPLKQLLTSFRSLFSLLPERPPFRLSGVSLEPSFNAFALLACVPWAALAATTTGRVRDRLLVALLIALCVASGARTAYIGVVMMAAAYILASGHLKRLLPRGGDGALLIILPFVLGIVLPPLVLFMIDGGSSVSDVTRSYLMTGAIKAGVADLRGQGFGQVAFHVVQHGSAAIDYSWELVEFYDGRRFGELPPLFSWYARTFGEFGVLGYVILGVSFAGTSKRVFIIGHHAKDPFLKQLFLIVALLIAQFLAIAFSIESVRVPQFWLAWLMVGLFIARSREQCAEMKDHYA